MLFFGSMPTLTLTLTPHPFNVNHVLHVHGKSSLHQCMLYSAKNSMCAHMHEERTYKPRLNMSLPDVCARIHACSCAQSANQHRSVSKG